MATDFKYEIPPFDPHPGQLEVIEAYKDYRFRVLNCGRRWGKTLLAVNEMLSEAYFNPNELVVYVAPTVSQARDIAWRQLKQSAVHFGGFEKMNETRLECTLNGKHGKSEIWLRGVENYESLRGLGIHFLVVDEVAMIRNWQTVWEEVLRATLSDTQGKVLMCSTPKGYNHWYRLWQIGQPGDDHNKDFKSWTFPSWNSPYFLESEREAAKSELTEDNFYQEYGAMFKRFTGLVFKSFDRDKQVIDTVDPEIFVYWLAGHDPGFHNPRAFHLTGVDAEGRWYQVDELYLPGLTNPQFKEECLRILDKWGIDFERIELPTMDSAHKSDIAELSDMGLSFVPVKKASGEQNKSWVRYKVDKFDERIRSGNYYVLRHCKKTIWEFENYAWPKTNDEKNPDESPAKLNDHMMDCLMDTNVMYLHMYEEDKPPVWKNKVPGTFIPPAVLEPENQAWTEELKDDYWELPL
jgi:hypothetical protein